MVVSLRKRYPGRIEESRNDGPAVASTPQTAAAQLPPVAEPKPAGPLEIEASPVEQAAHDAIKARIAELTETEPVKPVVIEQPNPTEQIIANTGLPPRVQAWLRSHPDYITDAAKNARMQEMHYVAKHHTGEEFTDAYLAKMEELLGFKPPALSVPVLGDGGRNTAPVRQQLRAGPPVSAPISRDAPSMSTGRPASAPTRLTAEELALVQSLGISPETYREKKRLMNELKANGTIQDGR